MPTTKKPQPLAHRALRTEIDVAHATLDRVPDLIGRGHNLTARVAAVVQRLAANDANLYAVARGTAEFINAVAEVFGVEVPAGREPTAAALLAELRAFREQARADAHNLHSAEDERARLIVDRDAVIAANETMRTHNAALRAELNAAVEAMGRTSDTERALMQIAGIACHAAADVVARGQS